MPVPLLLGAIADDFTGAADLASMLTTGGVRTALLLDPDRAPALQSSDFQAVVVALKSRSVPAVDARHASVAALEKLQDLGARQFYFKYCSTFDSSADGNIGPVSEALMDALDTAFTVAVPALPVNGRTQYNGYLFVGDRLLSETHMRDHPVHPMMDSNLVRHLQAQTSRRVGLIGLATVRRGASAIRGAIEHLSQEGVAIALVDALDDDDLNHIAGAATELPLATGGSGLGAAMAGVWKRRGDLRADADRAFTTLQPGGTLVLSGSCSDATLQQLAHLERHGGKGFRLDAIGLVTNRDEELNRAYASIRESLDRNGWALAYTSAAVDDRQTVLKEAGSRGWDGSALGALIESAHADIARRAVADGIVQHLVVAGGETSGAVAKALGIDALEVVDVLDPGVPLLRTLAPRSLGVTLKSGNFGSEDFFTKTVRRLSSTRTQII